MNEYRCPTFDPKLIHFEVEDFRFGWFSGRTKGVPAYGQEQRRGDSAVLREVESGDAGGAAPPEASKCSERLHRLVSAGRQTNESPDARLF